MSSRLVMLSACLGACAVASLMAAPATAAPWGAAPSLTAAYLFNFVKFAQWPPSTEVPAPIRLCVLNDQASEQALARLVAGNSLDGHDVTVQANVTRDRLRSCHLLYISGDDRKVPEDLLADVKGLPVLTVGDGKLFARRGGIVGLVFNDGRLQFAINPAAAQRSGVQLSSKLLSMAMLVRD